MRLADHLVVKSSKFKVKVKRARALAAAKRSKQNVAHIDTFSSQKGLKIMNDFLHPIPLPELPYDYGDLEPVISADIMRLHHTKHHQTYVDNLNKAVEKLRSCASSGDLNGMIDQQKAIRFHGGGHINHSIFWTNLAPAKQKGGEEPRGDLLDQIRSDFSDLSHFIEKMSQSAIAIQGSGWAWLGYRKETKRLEIATCANQDPVSLQGLIPLLGIDVWEHAYYLQYKSARAEYVKKIWDIVNWQNVASRFAKASML